MPSKVSTPRFVGYSEFLIPSYHISKQEQPETASIRQGEYGLDQESVIDSFGLESHSLFYWTGPSHLLVRPWATKSESAIVADDDDEDDDVVLSVPTDEQVCEVKGLSIFVMQLF